MHINKHGLFFFTDFDGPYIFADNESPLLASSTVELTCLVYTNGTTYDTLELIWEFAIFAVQLQFSLWYEGRTLMDNVDITIDEFA
jgi:hypothetical protein